MTMGDDTPVSTLVLPVLLRPILSQVKIFHFVCYFIERKENNCDSL